MYALLKTIVVMSDEIIVVHAMKKKEINVDTISCMTL